MVGAGGHGVPSISADQGGTLSFLSQLVASVSDGCSANSRWVGAGGDCRRSWVWREAEGSLSDVIGGAQKVAEVWRHTWTPCRPLPSYTYKDPAQPGSGEKVVGQVDPDLWTWGRSRRVPTSEQICQLCTCAQAWCWETGLLTPFGGICESDTVLLSVCRAGV